MAEETVNVKRSLLERIRDHLQSLEKVPEDLLADLIECIPGTPTGGDV